MRVHIIANPAAGGGRGARLAEALKRELDARSIPAVLSHTQRAGDAKDLARASDAEYLVSVGGDGTTNEIVNGMDLDRACLTILPAGTANVVPRELGLTASPGTLAELITGNKIHTIDLGVLNGRRFLLGVGAGFDAEVARRVVEQKSNLRGVLRWIRPTLHTLWSFNHAPIQVTIDGEVLTTAATYAIIGNCRFTAGVVPMTPMARIDDGRLDLCAIDRVSTLRMLWLAASAWSPNFTTRRGLRYRQGTVIELEAANEVPVPIQVDGESAGFLPARCTVLPGALKIVAPT